MKRALGPIVAVAALVASCGHEAASSGPVAGPTEFAAASAGNHPRFLDLIPDAPFQVAYSGARRLEFHMPGPSGSTSSLIYDERVYSDGAGHFAIDPASTIQPPMNQTQRELFELMQKGREAFFYRYRDFRVRDLGLFDANYQVGDTGQAPVVAGRTCVELTIERRGDALVRYEAAVDPETGLVLRCLERSLAGELLARLEFTELTLNPDLSGVTWFEPRYGGTPMGSETEAATTLGFVPSAPQILPPGFQLLQSEAVAETDWRWMRRTYGDGVENLFFLHGRRGLGPLTIHDPVGVNLPQEIHIRYFEMGPWTIAQAFLAQSDILMVMGKASSDDVVQMLKSAL